MLEVNEIIGSRALSDLSITHIKSVALQKSANGAYQVSSEPSEWKVSQVKRDRAKEIYKGFIQLDKDSDHLLIASRAAI